jgi:hypothetical protein
LVAFQFDLELFNRFRVILRRFRQALRFTGLTPAV